jgi:hypothetical protein
VDEYLIDEYVNIATKLRQPDSVSVIFDTAAPNDLTSEEETVMIIPIAEVDDGGNVIDQVLTHNPVLTFDHAQTQ